jgi:hypothetical protein
LVGKIARAIKYFPREREVELKFTDGQIIQQPLENVIAVVPTWAGCARCSPLAIITNEKDPMMGFIGTVTRITEDKTYLEFRSGSVGQYWNHQVTPLTNGWWITLHPDAWSTDHNNSKFRSYDPAGMLPLWQGPRAGCSHSDGQALTC